MCRDCDCMQSIRCHQNWYQGKKKKKRNKAEIKLRFFELSSLVRWEHSKGCANFHVHSADLTNHLKNSFKTSFSTSKIPPSSTHTETCASVFLCFPSSFQNRFKLNKPWSRRWSRILWRLRAVRTYGRIGLRLIHLEEEWFTTNNLRCILQLEERKRNNINQDQRYKSEKQTFDVHESA